MKKLGIALLVAIALLGMSGDAFGAPSGNAGKLIITEVAFRATGGDWIELYVVDGSVDWSGYRIYKGITLRFTIPAIWETNGLTTGDCIVLHEETGTDDVNKSDNNSGYWDGYMSGGFTNTDDIVQIKESSGSTARVDAVI